MKEKRSPGTAKTDPLASEAVFRTLPEMDSRRAGLHASRLQLLYPGDDAHVPDFAALPNGEPYSGMAYGTVGIVDWSGSFKDGLRDGMFTITWGDRMTGVSWYRQGERVAPPQDSPDGA